MAQKSERAALQGALTALEGSPITARLVAGAKHPALLFEAPGLSERRTISCSGRSDATCQRNFGRQTAGKVRAEYESRPPPPLRPKA